MIEISGMFTNPLEAIRKISALKPQIVFLDINMPQLQGIDAASKILDICPDTEIIFVTAYDQYAIEAFELHALDYLLKPVSRERFEKTLQRVIKRNHISRQRSGKRLVIKCFGRFQMGWFGEDPVKWRTEKTKELFAFLLHHQGREISKNEILDQVWPEVKVDKAVHQLHNGIYYIRKSLEKYGIERSQINISGRYSVKLGSVDVDVLLFRERLTVIKNNSLAEDLEAVKKLYTGEYLEGTDCQWAYLERERLLMQYSEIVISLSQAYMQNKEFNKAEDELVKAYHRNNLDEKITELLMKLYYMIGDNAKAAKHFMEYAKILKEELGIKPQERIQRIYTSLK